MSYTCPKCGRTSHNPNDEANRYCGFCHAFERDLVRRHYILDDEHRPVKTDFLTAALWYEIDSNRQIADVHMPKHRISTIFLTMNHRHLGKGPPLLFETMVFRMSDGRVVDQIRYSTWDDAQTGHAAMVRRYQKIEADAKVSRREQ